jgi:excisionase family DNA binding protein
MNEIEQAERDRLKAENSYLLARLCELEARLNANLENLAVALSQLSKLVVPAGRPQLLTPEQAAEILQVTPEAIYKWISEKRIPFRRAGSKPRILLEELMAWTVPGPDGRRSASDKRRGNVVGLRRS